MEGHKVYLYEQGEKLCMMCFKKDDSLGKLLMEADTDNPVRMVEMTKFLVGEIFENESAPGGGLLMHCDRITAIMYTTHYVVDDLPYDMPYTIRKY